MRARVSYTELIKKYDEHFFSRALPCKKGKGIKELESILLSDIKAGNDDDEFLMSSDDVNNEDAAAADDDDDSDDSDDDTPR